MKKKSVKELTMKNIIVSELIPNESVSLSKADIQLNAKTIISAVEKGEWNALDVVTKLAFITDVCKQAREGIKEYAYEETGKWNGLERVEVNGATVSKMDSTSYDYSNCNDIEWNEYQRQMEVLKTKISERETFLKTLHDTLTIADEETGEMITLNPPVKHSEPTIKISFPSK